MHTDSQPLLRTSSSPRGRLRAGAALALGLIPLLGPGAWACDRAERELPDGPFGVADSLYDEGRWPEVAERYGALRDSLSETADTAAYWMATLRWADAERRMGRLDSARAGLDRALALAGEDPGREARTRYVLSRWYDRQGRFDEARAEAERILQLAREAGNRKAELDGLNALGRIHSLTGRYREALEVHERYLALAREVGTPEEIALALNEIGIDYRHFGRFADAVRAYEEALEIYRELDNRRRVGLVSYNLGNIHFDRGEMDEARRLYALSLRTAEELGIPRSQAFAHGALGVVYSRVGNASAARDHYARAIEINREIGYAYGSTWTLASLGELELDRGRLEAARAALESALALADSAGFARERAGVRASLGRLAARRGDSRSALDRSRTATAIADSLGDPAARYEALAARGFVLEEVGREEGALEAYGRAIDLLESWRGRVALGDLRLGVTRPRLEAYEGAIRILAGWGRAKEAFEVGEAARARLLLDLVAGGGTPRPAATAEEEASEEGLLRQRLRDLYGDWEDGDREERDSLDAEIVRVGRELVALQDEARRTDPLRGAARYPRPAELRELQADLVPETTQVLAYFWGERDVFGWRVSPDGVRAARLGSADSLSALVGFLRGTIEDAGSAPDWRPAAVRAYERLVAPLGPPSADRLWIIRDGPLVHIPFEVLMAEGEETPWGLGRRIAYGPSASILLALGRGSSGRDWDRQILAVGEPTLEERSDELPPLPYSGVEAREVGEVFGDGGADLLLGDDATVERWLQREPDRYRYLHFATHAVVSDRRPSATHLVFSGGRLDLGAIRSLRLNAELVTLSACETGLGRHVRGEGVIGLPHAFFTAGARGVVVSLWRVADRSAADFMSRFYGELGTGRAPAEALARVRRAYLEGGGPGAHPSRWAAFVLVGDS